MGIDLYPLQSGIRLGSVTSFGRFLGGSAANVAVAAARHGRRTALISRTGADDFGRFLREELERLGVSSEFVSTVEGLPTPITFCEIHPPDHFPITFYRYPKAPDMEIRPEDLDEESVGGARLFWITTTGLSQEPSRSAHHEALRMRDGAGLTVLDLDYREQFWSEDGDAREEIAAVLPQVDIVVGNLAECEVAVGETDPHRAGKALLERGPTTAVVKLGPEGVLGFEPTGPGLGAPGRSRGGERPGSWRRIRWSAVPWDLGGLAPAKSAGVRQHRRCDRRIAIGMLDGDAGH